MNPTKRYGLIAAGIVAFVILSPFIVLFITGTKYDFAAHRFIKTGVIGIKTNPKGADIFLNDKHSGSSNRTVRFVTPGNYLLEIKKPGYFTWSKALEVRPQYVTWAHSEDIPEVTLFFAKPQKTYIANSVSTFSARDRLVYLVNVNAENTVIVNASLDRPDQGVQTALAGSFPDLQIIADSNSNNFLIYQEDYYAIFDANNNTVTDITDLVNEKAAFSSTSPFQASKEDFQFGPGNILFQLQEGTIYKIGWQQKTKDPVADGVLAFSIKEDSLYLINVTVNLDGSLLRNFSIAQLPSFLQTVLVENLPAFREAEIFVSNRNQIFILGNNTLYSLGNELKVLADYVLSVDIDSESPNLVYATSNELSSYNMDNGSLSYITRSSKTIEMPGSAFKYGWVFYINDNRLQNMEIDVRSNQNNYTFAEITPGARYFLDDKIQNLILLNNGVLEKLKIR